MITIKTEKEISIMREGGGILAKIMKELEKEAKPGVTTEYLDKVASGLVLKYNGECSFKNYQGFPACLCVSVNEELVHVIPSERVLKEGDVVCLDLGIKHKGFHADMAVTVGIGKVEPEALRLIKVTKKALKRGIKKAKPGNTFGDIGNTISRYVESQGFSVIKDLCGHGIGREIHEDPQILNYGKRKTGPVIKEGMVFCIEPMVSTGDWRIKRAQDNYGYATKDDSVAAHFEHTIAITKKGAEILTEV
ncbi:MAG: type I methionyl aminopeptidase [Candidatus Pacebacteria bacterium]|nr:type I methionyl aminopeptidase [Candidatus Paceibacterota bacterium]